MMSPQQDVDARLERIRWGMGLIFSKLVNMTSLICKIDNQTKKVHISLSSYSTPIDEVAIVQIHFPHKR